MYVSSSESTLPAGRVGVDSKDLAYSKTVRKANYFISIADRRLRSETRFQKAKTPARWLAVFSLSTILPKKRYTLGPSLFQWKIGKSWT